MTYTNSPLVVYTKLSPNYGSRVRSSNPNGKISRITIHHMAGNLSVETCANVFNGSRQASSNYGIGSDGRIALYVEEKNRAWTSSSGDNDAKAVTIEVANNSGNPNWTVSDKALESLINLCVDICQRNDIEEVTFTGKLEGSNMTQHNWFAATACPGPYLKSKHDMIRDEINARLGAATKPSTPVTGGTEVEEIRWYRVRKTWKDAKSQIGAYKVLNNAKSCADSNPGYFVFDEDGTQLYPEAAKEIPVPVVTNETDKKLWDRLDVLGLTPAGKAAVIGNLDCESALRSTNLQNSFEGSLGYSDAEYTEAVDRGVHPDFVTDKAGYGLGQWTFHSRKEELLEFAQDQNKSIGDEDMQIDFVIVELPRYPSVIATLRTSNDVRECSNAVLIDYEAPAKKNEIETQNKRYEASMKYYNKFVKPAETPAQPEPTPVEPEKFTPYTVRVAITDLKIRKGPGTNYGTNGYTGKGTFTIVAESGGQGASKWGKLKSGAGWISLDYTDRVNVAKPTTPVKEEHTFAELEAVAKAVIQGKYGNGVTRKQKLEAEGWDYNQVQTIVDQMMSGTYKTKDNVVPTKKSNHEIALEVIRGLWGNGTERVRRLKAAGYNPDEIQDEVNSLYHNK